MSSLDRTEYFIDNLPKIMGILKAIAETLDTLPFGAKWGGEMAGAKWAGAKSETPSIPIGIEACPHFAPTSRNSTDSCPALRGSRVTLFNCTSIWRLS